MSFKILYRDFQTESNQTPGYKREMERHKDRDTEITLEIEPITLEIEPEGDIQRHFYRWKLKVREKKRVKVGHRRPMKLSDIQNLKVT